MLVCLGRKSRQRKHDLQWTIEHILNFSDDVMADWHPTVQPLRFNVAPAARARH